MNRDNISISDHGSEMIAALGKGAYLTTCSGGGTCTYLTTENADRFAQSASIFLNTPIVAEHRDL